MNSSALANLAAAMISSLLAPEPAQFDIPADGFVEEDVFLGHNGDLVAQIPRWQLREYPRRRFSRRRAGVVKAQQQIRQRGFAGATGPHQRHATGRI